MELSNEIDLLAKSFPVEERFSLSSQIKRAADSVVLNIAGGRTGQSNTVFKRFSGIAPRSAIEVVACLFLLSRGIIFPGKTLRSYMTNMKSLAKW